jgi:Concanavalin A-like lectin/glucanases superfamily
MGALAAALLLLPVGASGVAGAATLKASYRLQGTRASQLAGAPDLADIGPGSRFATETVDGTSRQVLAFPKGGGVALPTAGLVDPASHSIVMTFRLADVSGFRRLLDFSDGRSDNGLYDLDGRIVLYLGGDTVASPAAVLGTSYVQVALTSEATLGGSQWTAAYVNGTPVVAGTTAQDFGLGAGGLRFFKDNDSGGASGEQSAGALACALVYDGALTPSEVAQQAADRTLCPALRSAPPPRLPFRVGDYRGTTSQRLPIFFTVTPTSVEDVAFGWRARCADGRVHTNMIDLGGTRVRRGHFSVRGLLTTGGRAHVIGRLSGGRARGRLSRWAGSAFGTDCVARGIGWHAHVVAAPAPSA